MIIRKVEKNDVTEIIFLYEFVFKKRINRIEYDYFYYNSQKDEYFSCIAEVDGHIVGHNAIIEYEYESLEKKIKVGLSSGGMVHPLYSGLFFQILRKNMKLFSGDLIIAFPNKNSEKFFNEIFEFDIISQNYYSVCKNDFSSKSKPSIDSSFNRSDQFFRNRILKHPYHKYQTVKLGNTVVFYKLYGNNEIDLIYSSSFGEEFLVIVQNLLKLTDTINIIHWDSSYITSLGFKKKVNNVFAYKWSNLKTEKLFECQMIDSDIF